MLTKSQIRHKKPSAGALRSLDGEALRCGMLPQLIGRLLQTGEVQRFLQLRQLRRTVDVNEIVLILEPVDTHGMSLLGDDKGSITQPSGFVILRKEAETQLLRSCLFLGYSVARTIHFLS